MAGAAVSVRGTGISFYSSAESGHGTRTSHSDRFLWSRAVWLVEPKPEAMDAGVCAVLFLRGQYGCGDWALALSSRSTIRHMAQGAAVSRLYAIA